MGNELNHPILASKLAEMLNLPWKGNDTYITHVSPLSSSEEGSLCFCKTTNSDATKTPIVLIAPIGHNPHQGAVIEAINPRLTFARSLLAIEKTIGFSVANGKNLISKDANISKSATIGLGVTIGSRTTIEHNVVIADGVEIGSDCHIKSNTVIGESGFGYERDENNIPIKILHIGKVKIGDRVEIGSCNTICRATIGETVIEDDVKTDDHVHIAHNCRVQRGSLLTASVVLSGGVNVGEFSWIGPNSSVIQKIDIGNYSFVGIGSNVTKSVLTGSIVAGNPARLLRTN